MGLEVATYISGLNSSNPVGATDPKSQGDDHLRLIKSTLLNTFPNITGAMTASHTELNNLDGVTGKTGTGNVVLSASPTLTGTLTAAAITLTTDLAVANGGTGASTAAAARTNLGLAIGSAVQAYDADLAAIAALAKTDGNFIVGNGTTWVAESGATVRTSLGLGSLATLSRVNNSNWSGTDLAVANGGTGSSTAAGACANLGAAKTSGGTFTGDITMSGTRAIDATTRLNLTGTTVSVGEAAGNLAFFADATGASIRNVAGNPDVTNNGILLTQLLGALESYGLITRS